MEPVKTYDEFPLSLVMAAVLVNVSIYGLGAAILSGFGYVAAAIYVFFCLGNEIHIMKMSCVDCWYYGKRCAFGKGRIAPLLFKQGDPGRFAAKSITWKALLPDMLIVMIPLVGGTALLLSGFSWSLAIMLVLLLGLSSGGNYVVRSGFACKYCKQRELGCPAERLFSKR